MRNKAPTIENVPSQHELPDASSPASPIMQDPWRHIILSGISTKRLAVPYLLSTTNTVVSGTQASPTKRTKGRIPCQGDATAANMAAQRPWTLTAWTRPGAKDLRHRSVRSSLRNGEMCDNGVAWWVMPTSQATQAAKSDRARCPLSVAEDPPTSLWQSLTGLPLLKLTLHSF